MLNNFSHTHLSYNTNKCVYYEISNCIHNINIFNYIEETMN